MYKDRYDRKIDLHYPRARYYALELRRITPRDSTMFNGGINLYSYTGCDFVNYGDWWGLIELSGGIGAGAGFHMFAAGINIHYYRVYSPSGWVNVYVMCSRIGAGAYMGVGTELTAGISPDTANGDCNQNCSTSYSIGIGGDVAYLEGVGVSTGFSFSESGFQGFGISGYTRRLPGIAIGFSVGIDMCIIRTCK